MAYRFLFLPMDDLWEEAALASACHYLRGSVHLKASRRWKLVFLQEM